MRLCRCSALVLLACGGRTALDADTSPLDASVADAHPDAVPDADASSDARGDARDAAPDAPPSAVCDARDAGPGDGTVCRHTLTVTDLTRSSPTCFVDTGFVLGATGTLQTPCTGSGPATVTLGGHVFSGVFVEGSVDVCAGTTFVWDDGCTWTSAQHLFGDPASGTLAFTYAEAPQSGGVCASPCTAQATFRVD
jgi:hypothetical protein